MWNIW